MDRIDRFENMMACFSNQSLKPYNHVNIYPKDFSIIRNIACEECKKINTDYRVKDLKVPLGNGRNISPILFMRIQKIRDVCRVTRMKLRRPSHHCSEDEKQRDDVFLSTGDTICMPCNSNDNEFTIDNSQDWTKQGQRNDEDCDGGAAVERSIELSRVNREKIIEEMRRKYG